MDEALGTSLPQPKTGDSHGKWKLVARIGRGGNGEVWKAQHQDERFAAIKLLAKPKPIAYGRFRDEVKVMTECGVKGVVPIIDSHLPDDYLKERAWYVMPLGDPFLKALAGEDIAAIVEAIAVVAQALGELHAKGISHRDIKPENLLFIDKASHIGDFGLVDYPDKIKHTLEKERLGPRWAMAPEVFRLGSDADPKKADVFSLAKTLWILITGKSQGFDGQYASDSTASIEPYAHGEFLAPLEEVLAIATDHEPGKRPTMEEFGSKLRKWLAINADYHSRTPLEWEQIQRKLFPFALPVRAVWTDPKEMVNLLDLLGTRSDMNHLFFPNGGGLDLSGAHISNREPGCIELEFGGSTYLLKPLRLMFESFAYESQWNYFQLEADRLEPSGIYERMDDSEMHEEVTDLGAQGYVSRVYWDEGEYMGERLPKEARPLVRFFRGAFVIFQKTSTYNNISETYDGRHNRMDADAFRAYIERGVSHVKNRKPPIERRFK